MSIHRISRAPRLKTIWLMLPSNSRLYTTERYENLIEQVTKRLHAETGAKIIIFHAAKEKPETRADFLAQLPPELRESLGPDMLLIATRASDAPPKEWFPDTFKVFTGGGVNETSKNADLCLLEGNSNNYELTPDMPKTLFFPLTHCAFDPIRYANAQKKYAATPPPDVAPGKTLLLMLGNLQNIPVDLLRQARAVARNYTKLLITCSPRMGLEDWEDCKHTFGYGNNAEFYRPKEKMDTSRANPKYRFMAEADHILVLDSASMAAEAAHTGKPVSADTHTIEHWEGIVPYVQAFTPETTVLDNPPVQKMDIAGSIATMTLGAYEEYARAHHASQFKSPKGSQARAAKGACAARG